MPPKGFRLVWTSLGERFAHGERATLWIAPLTDLLTHAYRSGQYNRMWKLGYSRGLSGAEFWEKPNLDPEATAAEIRAITLEVRAWRTKRRIKRRAKAAKEAAIRADLLARRKTAQADLRRIMIERRWAIHHSFLERAHYLNALHELPDDLADEAARIVKSTDDTVAKATESLNAPAPEAAVSFCQDPAVREAIGVALRKITETDADWATHKNHIGWSKTTTVKGHVLTMQETLTENLAAHAMVLLHIHRTQVPDAVRPILGMGAA